MKPTIRSGPVIYACFIISGTLYHARKTERCLGHGRATEGGTAPLPDSLPSGYTVVGRNSSDGRHVDIHSVLFQVYKPSPPSSTPFDRSLSLPSRPSSLPSPASYLSLTSRSSTCAAIDASISRLVTLRSGLHWALFDTRLLGVTRIQRNC